MMLCKTEIKIYPSKDMSFSVVVSVGLNMHREFLEEIFKKNGQNKYYFNVYGTDGKHLNIR